MRLIGRIASDPRKYLRLVPKVLLQRLSPLLQRTSFYLQGQMDIHPTARWPSQVTATTGGFFPPNTRPYERRIFNLEAHDNTRRDMLVLLLRTVVTKGIEGDFAELGVYRGLSARLIHHYAPERALHLFDTFEGFTSRGVTTEFGRTGVRYKDLFTDATDKSAVAFIQPRGRSTDGGVFIYPGYFPETITEKVRDRRFAFVHLDADLYEPTIEGLRFFYPRMSKHGIIVVHDYNAWIGARTAVDEFFSDKPELPVPMPDKSGSVVIVKTA